jgi:flagellar protein FliL
MGRGDARRRPCPFPFGVLRRELRREGPAAKRREGEGARAGLRVAKLCPIVAVLLFALAAPSFAAEHGEHVHAGKEPSPGAPVFIDMQPIVLPVIEGKNVTRQVGVLLTVELAQGHVSDDVEEKRRELTDAFITELYRIYGWRSGADRVVNETLVKRHLQASADRILGKGVVQAVLIRRLVEQER